MNTKQTVPLLAAGSTLAAAAPALLVFAGIGLTLYWLLSDDKEKKPDAPADTGNGNFPKPTPAPIPPPVPKPAPAPVPVPTVKPPLVPVVPASAKQHAHREVTRGDLTAIFNNGTRALTRTAAVSALKALGFGKTAAYKALSMDERFAPWLQFAQDGMITWKALS